MSKNLDTSSYSTHSGSTTASEVCCERRQERAISKKGLLIVFTGSGKGKTTAAFGMALRAIGHNMQVGIVQFIKKKQDSSEKAVLSRFRNIDFKVIGDGFTWITKDRKQDIVTAKRAWNESERMINNPRYELVILDELNLVLKYGYLDLALVIETIIRRRSGLHVVVTGRHAPQELVRIADLVSDITSIKHPYHEQGIKAQKGIEF